MAQSKRDIKPGREYTKVAGDDEMLRTGFYDGTPLEGGKIADSQPVDLFAAAHRVAEAPDSQQRQKEQRQADEEGTTNNHKNVIADAEANPAATAPEQPGRRQGVAEPPAGGRRLGVGRPPYTTD